MPDPSCYETSRSGDVAVGCRMKEATAMGTRTGLPVPAEAVVGV